MCLTIRTARFGVAVTLRDHVKRHIARQCSTGRDNRDKTRSRANRNRGSYECVRNNRKARRNSVERDADGFSESLSKDAENLSGFRWISHERNERTKARVEAKDRAAAFRTDSIPPQLGCPVENPIGGLKQPADRASAVGFIEAMQRREGAFGGYLENRAQVPRPARLGSSVEISVRSLN